MLDLTPIDGEFNMWAKEARIAQEWADPRLDLRVKVIVRCMAYWLDIEGYRCILTEVFRADGGIHAAWRAVDVRSTHIPLELAQEIRSKVNHMFPYRNGYFDTIPPLNHAGNASRSTADHFHVQVRAAA